MTITNTITLEEFKKQLAAGATNNFNTTVSADDITVQAMVNGVKTDFTEFIVNVNVKVKS